MAQPMAAHDPGPSCSTSAIGTSSRCILEPVASRPGRKARAADNPGGTISKGVGGTGLRNTCREPRTAETKSAPVPSRRRGPYHRPDVIDALASGKAAKVRPGWLQAGLLAYGFRGVKR